MNSHIHFELDALELHLLDQRLLPIEEKTFICKNTEDIIYALQTMVIRGAPAIGVTAAWGCLLALVEVKNKPTWQAELKQKIDLIALARPTAINLLWAVKRMTKLWYAHANLDWDNLFKIWLDEASLMQSDDIAINKMIGKYGAECIQNNDVIMTHCNAGALATAGYGTALGVIRAAVEAGKKISVIANETRPFLQGARLTAYELAKDNIKVSVACDNACGLLMQRKMVQCVVVGADRIAANGDTANKIGTYSVALLAKAHNIPFYVAAPLSTIDLETANGQGIPIEVRPDLEVTHIGTKQIIPENVHVYNYAFDITPAELITGIITEKGILKAPYDISIVNAFK